MSIEPKIVTALDGMKVFKHVNYLVAGADLEITPTMLPIAVVSDGGRDYTEFATFCGSDAFVQSIEILVIAKTAEHLRNITDSLPTVLAGLVSIESAQDGFDDELSAYVCNLTFTF